MFSDLLKYRPFLSTPIGYGLPERTRAQRLKHELVLLIATIAVTYSTAITMMI
jgi:hypothetical protein